MQDDLCEEADAERYPTMQRLRAARGTPAMPSPREASKLLAEVIPHLLARPSGGYVDVRKFDIPSTQAQAQAGPDSTAQAQG